MKVVWKWNSKILVTTFNKCFVLWIQTKTFWSLWWGLMSGANWALVLRDRAHVVFDTRAHALLSRPYCRLVLWRDLQSNGNCPTAWLHSILLFWEPWNSLLLHETRVHMNDKLTHWAFFVKTNLFYVLAGLVHYSVSYMLYIQYQSNCIQSHRIRNL